MQSSEIFRGSGKTARKTAEASYGFTLTEIAIVLGVIGVVVAGIFAAYSATEYHILLNQGVDEINFIVANMRSLYASQNASAVPNTLASAAFEQQLVGQNVFPKEMLITTGSGTFAFNPWDQAAANGSAQISLVAAAEPTPAWFVLSYLNIPPDVCADLLVHNSMPGADTGLQLILVDGAPAGTAFNGSLPISPINAAIACPTGTPLNTINWYYTLGS